MIQIRYAGQLDSRSYLVWQHDAAAITKLGSLGLIFAEEASAIQASLGGVYAVSGNVTMPPNLVWPEDCFYGINIVRATNCPPNSATAYRPIPTAFGTPPNVISAELTFIPVTFQLGPHELFSVRAFFVKCPVANFLSGNLWINKLT